MNRRYSDAWKRPIRDGNDQPRPLSRLATSAIGAGIRGDAATREHPRVCGPGDDDDGDLGQGDKISFFQRRT
jgi:hypothetical protein